MEKTVAETAHNVAELATVEKVKDAVAEGFEQGRASVLTTWQKLLAAVVSFAAIGAFAVAIYNAATG